MKWYAWALTFLIVSNLSLKAEDITPISEKISQTQYNNWLESKYQNAKVYIPTIQDFVKLKQELAGSGFGPGNGGNEYLFEIDRIAKDILSYMDDNKIIFPEVNLADFEETLATTAVFFLNELPQDKEKFVQALNWQDHRLILLNRKAWVNLNLETKYKLVFHEYLGGMGLELNNAHISNRFDLSRYFQSKSRYLVDWKTVKLIYSNSNAVQYALSLDLDFQRRDGKLKTQYGEGKVSWSKRAESLHMIVRDKNIVSENYEIVESAKFGGHAVQIRVQSYLLEMEIRKISQVQYEVRGLWSDCYFYSEYPGGEYEDECFINEKTMNQSLVATENIKPLSIEHNDGDLFVLPNAHYDINLSDVSLVELIKGNRFSVLMRSSEHKDNYLKWSIVNNELVVEMDSGTTYKIKVIKSLRGTMRALIEFADKDVKSIFVGAFFRVNKKDLPKVTFDNFKGEYLPIYAGSAHTNEEFPSYFYNENGYGGFESFWEGGSTNNFWKWEVTNGVVTSTRKMNSNGMVEDQASYESCGDCWDFGKRTMKVLKVSGNRYTMLRRMVIKLPVNGDLKNLNTVGDRVDFWVMDKI